MAAWITVDEAYLLGAMPTALRTAYDDWLAANPSKAGRLAALTAGVVADFREGLRREGAEALDREADRLPERCLRHAVACVCSHLAVEMGEEEFAAGSKALAVRAGKVLDRMLAGRGPAGTPRYRARVPREARASGDL